jgi:glycosyltransferase involved in cell wall biosynthesis
MSSLPRIDAHVAVHYLGCAVQLADERIAMPSAHGPFVECLADLVREVTVVAYDPPPGVVGLEDMVEYEAYAPRGNVSFRSLGPKGTWRELRERRRRVRLVVGQASEGWDVLLLRLVNRRAWMVVEASRCDRLVSTLGGHTPSVIRRSGLRGSALVRSLSAAYLAEIFLVRILRRSRLALVNSEYLLAHYRRLVPHVELVRSSTRRRKYSFRAEDRFDRPVIDVLIVGRIAFSKGVRDVLDAFTSLSRDLNVRLNVVGEGDAVEWLKSELETSGLGDKAVFHGWVPVGPALFDVYRAMDVLLMLSPAESFPRTVWEALAHSVLVVSTPVGGLPDALEHGREVLFVPVSDGEATANAVRTLVRDADLRRTMIERGYERAREAELESVVEKIVRRIGEAWPDLQDRGHDVDA